MAADRLALTGRTVMVAGAGGGGIGTAICRMIAEAGAAVVAVDVDDERLRTARAALAGVDGRYLAVRADVRDEAETERVVDQATGQLGPVDGLVHVVGGLRYDLWAPLARTSLQDFEEVVRLNLGSALVTSRVVAGRLIERGVGGSIVNIASIVGLDAMPFGVGYAAAKAGMMALTRTAAIEWGPHGIRVNAVAPGTIRTPKNTTAASPPDTDAERTALPLGRRGRPEDVAGAVLFLLSDLSAFVTGQVLAVDGGSSIRPSYLDADNLPVFVHEGDLRRRLTGPG